jgi:hypothetical protein
MRWALRLHRLGGLGLGWEWAAYPKSALACGRARWLGSNLRRLHRCMLCQRRYGRPQGRVRCQHAKVAVAVHTRWWHQRGKAGYEFERRKVQLVGLCTVLCTSLCAALLPPAATRFAVLFGAAVDQLTARFAQPFKRKRWARAVPQQSLQARAVLRCNAHAGVHRKPADWTDGYGSGDDAKKVMHCNSSELVAGLRCFVGLHLGDEVSLPVEILK